MWSGGTNLLAGKLFLEVHPEPVVVIAAAAPFLGGDGEGDFVRGALSPGAFAPVLPLGGLSQQAAVPSRQGSEPIESEATLVAVDLAMACTQATTKKREGGCG